MTIRQGSSASAPQSSTRVPNPQPERPQQLRELGAKATVSLCPYCGLSANTPHASDADCVMALREEVDRRRRTTRRD